jgi:hypothetical protein
MHPFNLFSPGEFISVDNAYTVLKVFHLSMYNIEHFRFSISYLLLLGAY